MYKYRIPNEFNQADKIGKLAMPQAVVLAIGVTIFVLCVITFELVISLLLAVPIGLTTLVFMFVKVNKVPLYEFLMIYLLYIGTPKLLIYRSDNLKGFEEQEEQIGFLETKNHPSKVNNKGVAKVKLNKNTKKQPSETKNSINKSVKKQKNIQKKGVKK